MASREQLTKIPVGVSACLLGDEVRYNGGHKHQSYLTDVLANYFDFRSFCPEVAIGMGVPREPIRLIGELSSPRAVGTKDSGLDVTERLLEYAVSMVPQVAQYSGFIWMQDSPSCGMFNTKVYQKPNVLPAKGAGLVAGLVRHRLPQIPMEESGRLADPALRENFVVRVFVYDEWRRMLEGAPSSAALVAFHSRHKYLVMSYGQTLYRELGRMVARAGSEAIEPLANAYCSIFMAGTEKPPSRTGHVNVLYHILGYLKDALGSSIRQDLVQSIEEYRTGQVPLAVPMKMMSHYADNYASDYIKMQSYLHPHPFELGLRDAL